MYVSELMSLFTLHLCSTVFDMVVKKNISKQERKRQNKLKLVVKLETSRFFL